KHSKKMGRYLDEMMTYIGNNQAMIPNYGERHRYGEPISTAFVESTVNEVIAKRMAKKQQMQWSQEGAHYLLQTRVAVLNDELESIF
ncbi:ISKra4 family transposase, partial [Xenorhabdus bovienii]|nr:ISKra4 family transposase [Xenorhabdus bovienii]